MRYVGADVYHRDWGWWDRAGDWNGPDFRTTVDYLRKHGMGQLIYAFLYTVDTKSQVAQEHPDWVLGDTLDMSRPEVVAFMQSQLDAVCRALGRFRVAQRQRLHRRRATATTRRCSARTQASAR